MKDSGNLEREGGGRGERKEREERKEEREKFGLRNAKQGKLTRLDAIRKYTNAGGKFFIDGVY